MISILTNLKLFCLWSDSGCLPMELQWWTDLVENTKISWILSTNAKARLTRKPRYNGKHFRRRMFPLYRFSFYAYVGTLPQLWILDHSWEMSGSFGLADCWQTCWVWWCLGYPRIQTLLPSDSVRFSLPLSDRCTILPMNTWIEFTTEMNVNRVCLRKYLKVQSTLESLIIVPLVIKVPQSNGGAKSVLYDFLSGMSIHYSYFYKQLDFEPASVA